MIQLWVETVLIHWLVLTTSVPVSLWWSGRSLIIKEFVIDIQSFHQDWSVMVWWDLVVSFSIEFLLDHRLAIAKFVWISEMRKYYVNDRLYWYHDKKMVSQSSNWLTQSVCQIWEN